MSHSTIRDIAPFSRSKEAFRVYVILPLLPAFEGKIGSATGNALRVILHYNYASICRSVGSRLDS